MSGTAAKLSRNAAYHHCTVLVDVNECRLHDAISSKAEGVESRATQVLAQVWSLTQFYSVDFSQSRISVKSAFSTSAQSRFASAVFDSVPGPLRLAWHT